MTPTCGGAGTAQLYGAPGPGRLKTVVILRRMPIDAHQVRAWVPAALACVAIVAFAAGSSSLSSAKAAGGPGRWAVLFALCVAALIEAVPRLRRDGMPDGLRRFLWLPLAFVGLCFLS